MWSKKQYLEYSLEWCRQYMHDYATQWYKSGYRSTIAYNCYMKYREKAMVIKTELRELNP